MYLLRTHSLPKFFYILLGFITIFFFIFLGQMNVAQAPDVSLKPSLEQTIKKTPEIKEFIKLFNITPEEAQKLAEKRKELEGLGLYDLTSGQLGNLTYRAIKLDGRLIFPIAGNIQNDKKILEARVQKIENTLREIVRRNFPSDEIRVFPAILNKQIVLVISRTNQPSDSDSDFSKNGC